MLLDDYEEVEAVARRLPYVTGWLVMRVDSRSRCYEFTDSSFALSLDRLEKRLRGV